MSKCSICGNLYNWDANDHCPKCEKRWEADMSIGRIPKEVKNAGLKKIDLGEWQKLDVIERRVKDGKMNVAQAVEEKATIIKEIIGAHQKRAKLLHDRQRLEYPVKYPKNPDFKLY